MNNLYQYYQPLELIAWQLKQQPEVTTLFAEIPQQAKLVVITDTAELTGKTDQLFTAMLRAINLKREDVSTTSFEEMLTNINQQIALLQPTVVLAVGEAAAQSLLNTKQSLESLRGTIHHIGDSQTPLIVTYHPADLLRNPSDKKMAYLDLQFTQKTLLTSL